MNALEKLSTPDFIAFASVFALTFLSVWYGRRKLAQQKDRNENTAELLLMGRRITLPLFVASLVASWYGGISGVTALTYDMGLYNFLTQGVFWYATYLIFAFVLIPRIPAQQTASTFPEMVGLHLGPKAHKVTAVLNYINLLPIAYVVSVGIFVQFLTGWPLTLSSAAGLAVIFLYSLSGGLRNVVYADVIQFIVMIAAVAMVAIFSMIQYGSPTSLPALLPPEHLTLSGGQSLSNILIWGFIAISTLVDPIFYQRTFAAGSKQLAKKGILWATVVWFLFDCATTIGALYARAYMPGIKSDDSYLVYAMQLLPSGLKGLFLAGVLSAIISTLDANLFSASSVFAYDILKKKDFQKRRLQLSMLGAGLLALLISPLFDGNVVQVWKIMGSLSSSCLLFPWLLMMIFPKQKSEFRFLASVCSGIFWMIVGALLNHWGYSTLDGFYFGLSGSVLGFALSSWGRRTQNGPY